MAFSFLIWPILAMGQDPPHPVPPPNPLPQNAAVTEDPALPADMMPAPSPPPPITPVAAQIHPFLHVRTIKQPPLPAGYAPVFNVSAGYSVSNFGLPNSGRMALDGVNATFSADSGRLLGAKLDLGYASATNVLGSGRRMEALTYLAGPVFSLTDGSLLRSYAEVLVGRARVSGPVPTTTGGLSKGYAHYPALAVGGGAEYRLSPAFGLRISVDYLRTHFFNSSSVVRGQNDVRVMNSIVYYLGQPIRDRRKTAY